MHNCYFAGVNCGRLPNPRNGRVSLSGTGFGSTATYSCVKGFTLVGGRTRTCQANGAWSGKAPFCTFKKYGYGYGYGHGYPPYGF